jgi:hypothetical protein
MSAIPFPVDHYCVICGIHGGPTTERCECDWHCHADPACREEHRARDHGRAVLVQAPLIAGLPPTQAELDAVKRVFNERVAKVADELPDGTTVDAIRKLCERRGIFARDPKHDWGGAIQFLTDPVTGRWYRDDWVPSRREGNKQRRVAVLRRRRP